MKIEFIFLQLIVIVFIIFFYFNFANDHHQNIQWLTRHFNRTASTAQRWKLKISPTSCHCQGQATKNATGNLCLYQWVNRYQCLQRVDDLKESKTFPLQPSGCQLLRALKVDQSSVNIGNRIVGFIHPPFNALYTFELITISSSELWLSRNSSSQNLYRIAYTFVDLERITSIIPSSTKSPRIYMERGQKYWIEVLQTTSNMKSSLVVKWKYYNGQVEKDLGIINQKYISLLQQQDIVASLAQKQASHQTERWSFDWKSFNLPYQVDFGQSRLNQIEQYHHLKRLSIPDIMMNSVLDCHNQLPSYLLTVKNRFKQVMQVKYRIFGDEFRRYISPVRGTIQQSIPLARTDAENIAKQIFSQYRNDYMKIGKQLTLVETIRVEEKIDRSIGSRYFVELKVAQGSQHYQLSEYFYKNNTIAKLCYTIDFQWSNTTPINMVMVINHNHQYSLTKQNIFEIEKWYSQTAHMDRFTLTIVNNGFVNASTIKAILKASKLKGNYLWLDHSLKSTGVIPPFKQVLHYLRQHHTLTNTILLSFDPSVHFSASLIQEVRKKTIQGRQCFVPYIIHLNCGFTIEKPDGYVINNDFGVIACFLSDYQEVIDQGQPIKSYTMLLEKLVQHEVDMERTSYPHLFRPYRYH